MPSKSKSKPNPLLSIAYPASHLVDVGSRFSTDRILVFLGVVLAKMGSYPFAAYGFDAEWTTAMNALADEIQAARDAAAQHKAETIPTGTALDACVAHAKEWRRRAATVIAITPKQKAPARLATGSGARALIESITEVLPRIASAACAKSGGGPKLAAEGKALLTALIDARDAHVAATAKLSPALRALAAKKGVAYEELRRVARTARLIAPSDAHLFATAAHVRATPPHPKRNAGTPAAPGTPAS